MLKSEESYNDTVSLDETVSDRAAARNVQPNAEIEETIELRLSLNKNHKNISIYRK